MATNNRANLIRELIAQMETAQRRMENILERNSDPEFRLDSDEFDEALDSAMRALQRKMDSTAVNWEAARENDQRATQRMRQLVAAYEAHEAADAPAAAGGGPPVARSVTHNGPPGPQEWIVDTIPALHPAYAGEGWTYWEELPDGRYKWNPRQMTVEEANRAPRWTYGSFYPGEEDE